MILSDPRALENIVKYLEKAIYSDREPIYDWQSTEERYIAPNQYEKTEDWRSFRVGETWRCTASTTRRFQTIVSIPHRFIGKTVALLLDVGGEGLVRINGHIISGVTSYLLHSQLSKRTRTRVMLNDYPTKGEPITIEVEACLNFLESIYSIGIPNENTYEEYTLRTAEFAVINKEIESYYFDIRNALDAMYTFQNPACSLSAGNAQLNSTMQTLFSALNRDSYLYNRLIEAIQQSLSCLRMDSTINTLMESIIQAREVLTRALSLLPNKTNAMIRFVGQAHIDTAWLWPIKECIRKCAKTFSNTLSLMEQYPEYRFAFSQPQLFSYTEEFYPELFARVKEQVREGRIELVGNAWVEMDTNIPSGESLVRQLLYGRQYFLSRFSKVSRVFWMPDVFGYSWALPQIMKRSGVDYFYTSKLRNNDTNRFPHALFIWQGIDGTQVLAYLQRLSYNGELNAATLSDIYQLFDQKSICETAMMTFGYGDGGGGPSYQMLENAMRLKAFPGLPASEISTAESFFEEAEKVRNNLPLWNDEMYYEFHRGTYTSQANTKKNNRKTELLLRQAEIACSFAYIYLGKPYPASEFEKLWKLLLTNQFHDILPGSSIHEVYLDCDKSYSYVYTSAKMLQQEAIEALNAKIDSGTDEIIVWNFQNWQTSDRVMYGETAFYADNVPPMGYKCFKTKSLPIQVQDEIVFADLHRLENHYLRVMLDNNGNLISLYDKENDRETLTDSMASNLLTVFMDKPQRESAWNIDLDYQNKYWDLKKADIVTVIETSPLRGVVRIVRSFNHSSITQDIVLTKNARRVDFETAVDWQETDRMLKAAFYVQVLSVKATYEIQFGAIERPTHWNTSYDKARFEVCGHKWADLSEGNYGVSLLNDCKYGYDIKDNCMRLTLLRSPDYPDPTADRGIHQFVYSLYVHTGDWRHGKTVCEAYRLNVPLLCYAGKGAYALSIPKSFAVLDRDNVVLDTVKAAENGKGIIIRIYESQGARCKTQLRFGKIPTRVTECNLMESDESTMVLYEENFTFFIKPYEIKTFRLEY